MIATMIKESRTAKGLTQKELAEQTKISHRSIVRIENGQVNPRIYTLKILAKHLDLSLDKLRQKSEEYEQLHGRNGLKRILSFGSMLVILLGAFSFLIQAATFPETTFELINFWIGIIALITGVLYWIWRK